MKVTTIKNRNAAAIHDHFSYLFEVGIR